MTDLRFYEIWRKAEFVEKLLLGVLTSVSLTVLACIVGLLFGLALAVARRSSFAAIRFPASGYVEAIRNTPLIVQLFFICFGLPALLDYRWPFFASALFALCLNFSAYYAEIIGAGLDNVKKGQLEAGRALGLSKTEILSRVMLPQAAAGVYPSLVSQLVFLFLTTGIISEVGVEDLTWAGRYIADRNFRDFEVFLLLAAGYAGIAVMFRAVLTAAGKALFPWWRET